MKIKLAGFNVDIDLLTEAASKLSDDGEKFWESATPETISAAYARISRDPRPIDELRANAITSITKARASNQQIVFGLGHASVAEHAVFNFDIMGVSRLAIEAIEHARLCSYTEKSQRYITLKDDFVIPLEVIEAGLENRFRETIAKQHEAYHVIYKGIYDYLLTQQPNASKEEQKTIEGKAKEDARYVTSLAVEGQLGMTCNARNLEYMIRRLLCHPLHEIKDIGALLYSEARDIAPSLLRYLEPTQDQLQAISDLRVLAAEMAPEPSVSSGELVQLLDFDENADEKIMGALLHTYTGLDLAQCQNCWKHAEPEQGNRLLRAVFGSLQLWDSLPRAFELADFHFELVISAACFAQLKRHRMATLLPQRYNLALGYTTPPTVQEAGLEEQFQKVMWDSVSLYNELVERGIPLVAPYILTQAHRRRVIVKMNARELYHFSRMRQDSHAQWDIREVANLMLAKAKRTCPLTMSLACGKDSFEQCKSQVLESL
jgi:flavin-dependent thymidylate synthase